MPRRWVKYTIVLQWGRVPMNAEIAPAEIRLPMFVRASMGPRSDERGNIAKQTGNTDQLALQWGRVPMNAEMAIIGRIHYRQQALQWGRVPMNAEITTSAQDGTSIAALQWGRVPMNAEILSSPDAAGMAESLQWGRVPMNAEMRRGRRFARRKRGFNGAAFR